MSSYSTSYSSGFSFKHPLKSPRVIDHELLMRLSSHCPRRVSGSVASLRHASFSKVLKPSIVFGFRSSEIEAHRRAVKAVELWVFTKIIAMSLVGDDASLPGSIFGLAKPQIYRILFLSDVTTAILPINEVTEVCVPSKSRHNEAASLSFREWYDALMAVSPRAAWFVARRFQYHATLYQNLDTISPSLYDAWRIQLQGPASFADWTVPYLFDVTLPTPPARLQCEPELAPR
jgi:hypothetical protein